jgi:hypothetical protein
MLGGERLHRLDLHDHGARDESVCEELSHALAAKADRDGALGLDDQTLLLQHQLQGLVVNRLQELGAQFVDDLECTPTGLDRQEVRATRPCLGCDLLPAWTWGVLDVDLLYAKKP